MKTSDCHCIGEVFLTSVGCCWVECGVRFFKKGNTTDRGGHGVLDVLLNTKYLVSACVC